MPTTSLEVARFQPASDQSLLVRWGDEITIGAHQQVRKLLHMLQAKPIMGVRNLNPAYCSLLVNFDPLQLTFHELEAILRGYLGRAEGVRLPETRLLEIPVSYGGEFGPDLNDVADLQGLTPDQIVELHAATTYVVYFLGFVPGFAYLGELPKALAVPRLAKPRPRVPPGSVGIAAKQTGIYPFAVPGGWRLIGRTPMAIFRKDQNHMSLLSIGDRVRFTPIAKARFLSPGFA